MGRAHFLSVLFFLSAFSLESETMKDVLKFFNNNVIMVNVTANVISGSGECLWTTNISKITINGRSVKVKISGGNVIVITDITPYLDDGDTILLVSQGDVWIGSSHSDTVKHYATIKSIPVRSGERAYFFPLGVVGSSEDMYTIELEIQVFLNPDMHSETGDNK